MESMIRHVKSYLNILAGEIPDKVIRLEAPDFEIGVCPCGYKTDNTFPAPEQFTPFEWGGQWGTKGDSHAWFHIDIKVPEDMRGDPTLELCVHTDRAGWDADNPQFLCYVDGVMRQGFDTNHRELTLGGEKDRYDVYIYAYTGPRVESTSFMPYLRTVKEDVRQLYYDIMVPRQALDAMSSNSPEYMEILTALSMALRKVNVLEPRGDEFRRTVADARNYLRDRLYDRGRDSETAVICIGHTHIDIAWLWTVGQTREKAQRSFATVIELMKRYPEYKFMSSQAYLYKAVKEEAPELYEEIKKMIKAGRWEVEGAMWVEADCNLSSGESLVRQVLYGKNFFRDEFGVESRVLWLPDVFGYSAALPQILRKSGVDWFVTSKISWNDVNTMPYDVFRWRGVDGTPINAYFLTAQYKGQTDAFTKGTTYVATTDPKMIAGSYNRFQQKELTRESMVTFGYGDGGGGPTSEMLEMLRRQDHGIPGLPRGQIDFAGNMLRRLEKQIAGNPRLPEWQGELYLEFHRGTYTSNARNKKNNRNCEFLMLDSEMLSVAARVAAGLPFPKSELRGMWETVLVNQFHDIIPGSSIREVYEQCDREYAEIRRGTAALRARAVNALAALVNTDKPYLVFNPHSFVGRGYVDVDGAAVYVDNIPPKGLRALDLRARPGLVKFTWGQTPEASGAAGELTRGQTPEASAAAGEPTWGQTAEASAAAGGTVDTPFYRCVFDENWEIASLYDKVNKREVLATAECGECECGEFEGGDRPGFAHGDRPGFENKACEGDNYGRRGARGNELRIYEDYPDQYDAWEIQEFSGYKYYTLHEFENVEFIERGGKSGVKITRRYGVSTIVQTVWFYGEDPRIDFETEIDWDSLHRILRTAFPINVNADKASFEIQFGTIERPTHKNTSWDRQKFETCAQKYADLSEGDYGVSLLNDCKYGHDVHGNLMQLTLLKRPTYPNEVADQGHHSFTYSLLPHRGPLSESDTVRQAYLLNYPMYAVKVLDHGDRPANETAGSALNAGAGEGLNAGIETLAATTDSVDSKASGGAFKPLSALGDTWSLVSCSAPNMVIETVKEAEYSGDIIVRGYEANNCRGNASIRFGFTPAEVWLSDLSENKVKRLEIVDNTVSVPFKPFEILTLRVVL